jgi:TusA-related sulfurtransferase
VDIRTVSHVFIPTLEVIHDGTAIVLRDIPHDLKKRKKVEEVARGKAGPTKIRSKLHVRGT